MVGLPQGLLQVSQGRLQLVDVRCTQAVHQCHHAILGHPRGRWRVGPYDLAAPADKVNTYTQPMKTGSALLLRLTVSRQTFLCAGQERVWHSLEQNRAALHRLPPIS